MSSLFMSDMAVLSMFYSTPLYGQFIALFSTPSKMNNFFCQQKNNVENILVCAVKDVGSSQKHVLNSNRRQLLQYITYSTKTHLGSFVLCALSIEQRTQDCFQKEKQFLFNGISTNAFGYFFLLLYQHFSMHPFACTSRSRSSSAHTDKKRTEKLSLI